mmetsp:Transcript_19259/g.25005  ORF Transcript_19259/g.25005 Transcript_19259/m.25005 type:complete len:202 (-) Transcript_19259:126-731(-)
MAFSLIEAFSETCLFKKPELNIVMIGIDNAGKTAILERLKGAFSSRARKPVPLEKLTSTVGLNIGKLDMCGCRVLFWDLGGDKNLRELWERYFSDAHGWIYVLDAAAEPSRLAESKYEFFKACDHCDLQSLPCLVIANKQDLTSALSADEISRTLDIVHRSTSDRTIIVHSASALRMEGINESVQQFVDLVKHHTVISSST